MAARRPIVRVSGRNKELPSGDTVAGTDDRADVSHGHAIADVSGLQTALDAAVTDVQEFTGNGTWTKPSGYSAAARVHVEMLSGGGSGASRSTTGNAAGGDGGKFFEFWQKLSEMDATCAVTVGADVAGQTGNSNGTPGTNVSIAIGGKTLTITGGNNTGTRNAASGAGAVTNNTRAQAIDMPAIPNSGTANTLPRGQLYVEGSSSITAAALFGGYNNALGGGVLTTNVPLAAGDSMHGGAGGGASSSTSGGVRTGGQSWRHGNGGNGGTNAGGNGSNGVAPGGGGGAAVQGGTSGIGRKGYVRVTVFPG